MLPEEDVAETGEDTVEAPEKDAKAEPAKDVEARARRMGWREKEKFRGDPDEWVDAGEFVRRGEEEVPILKSRLRELEKRDGETTKLMRELVENQKKQTERAVSDAIARLKAERREAVKDGDVDRVEQIDDRIDGLKKDAAPKPAYVETAPSNKEYVDWARANPWFNTDTRMHYAAIAELDLINADPEKSDLPDREKLKLVSQAVRTQFHGKFASAKHRPAASAVEGGSQAKRSEGGKAWNDLPADVRQIADRLVSRGVVTKDEYLRNYAWN